MKKLKILTMELNDSWGIFEINQRPEGEGRGQQNFLYANSNQRSRSQAV